MTEVVNQRCGCRVWQNPITGRRDKCQCQIRSPHDALQNAEQFMDKAVQWCRENNGEHVARGLERYRLDTQRKGESDGG